MKSIHPIAHQLSLAEDKIMALERENHGLRIELSRVTGQKIRPPTARLFSTIKHNRKSTSEQHVPAYARSTTTSRLRGWASTASSSGSTSPSTDQTSNPPTSPKHVRVNGSYCAYRDGKLDVMRYPTRDSWSNAQIGYLTPTAASRSRERISLLTRNHLRNTPHNFQTATDESGQDYSKNESYDADFSEETDEVHHPQPANTFRIMSQKEWDDMITQKGIAIRTRLADGSWTRGYAYIVYIDHDALFDILSQTEALAKCCLWDWMRTHRPYECRRWFGYRSNIDFGRERLERFLGHLPGGLFNFRHTQSWQVKLRLSTLIPMRNFLHHFSGESRNVCHMDQDIESVQKLAILLYDEESATRARRLRDRLREEAERTLQEVETFMMWTCLPFPETGDLWKPHHADMIRSAASDLGRGNLMGLYPPIVYTAARELACHRGRREFGVSEPGLDASSELQSKSVGQQDLPSTTDSVHDTFTSGTKLTRPIHLKRRCSISADVDCKMAVVGGRAGLGTRRRAASISHM